MRISDWSSEVCSSDLLGGQVVRCALQVEDVVGDRVVGGGRVLEVGRLGGGHGTSLRLQAGNREWGMRGMAGSRRRDGHAGARLRRHSAALESGNGEWEMKGMKGMKGPCSGDDAPGPGCAIPQAPETRKIGRAHV